VEQFSDDLGNLVDALKFECFYVGGHSLGGMIALEYARTHADRVVGVLSAEGWTNRFAGQDAFESRAMDFLPSELRKRRDAEIAEVTANWSEDDREAFAPVWSRWDGAEFLRSTDTPVLHVYGDRGAPRPPISRLHIPDRAIFEFHWVPNVAHTLPWECPARLAALFTAFMREHAPKL
jgi:pimeloyl-ACP methyl ester carboxylesterase